MFIETQPTIFKLFKSQILNIEDLRPLLFVGEHGLGKEFFFKEFLKDLHCDKYSPFSWNFCLHLLIDSGLGKKLTMAADSIKSIPF